MGFQEIFNYRYFGLTEILFPKRCISCRGYSVWFCNTCNFSNQLTEISLGNCAYCTKSISQSKCFGDLCKECKGELNIVGLFYFYSYKSNVIARALHTIKYRGVVILVDIFADSFYKRFSEIPYISRPSRLTDIEKTKVHLIPIPLHVRKNRARGFNQSELFARKLAIKFGWEIDDEFLDKRRASLSQTKLTKAERRENVTDIFRVKKDIQKDVVYILVDDVITTGTTIAEASKVLKEGGAKYVYAITIARG